MRSCLTNRWMLRQTLQQSRRSLSWTTLIDWPEEFLQVIELWRWQNQDSDDDTYKCLHLLTGSFSEIRIGEHMANGIKIACKLEPISSKLPQLQFEQRFYEKLKSENGFPIIYYYGQCSLYHVLVMQLLDIDLEQAFNLCKRQFSLKTIIYLAIQLISRFETIHRKGIVYRDVI